MPAFGFDTKGRASLVRLTLVCVSIVCALTAGFLLFDNTNEKQVEKKKIMKINSLGLPKVSIQNFSSMPEESQELTTKWAVDLFPNGVPYATRNGDYLIWNGQNFSYTGSSPSVLRSMKRANATAMEGIPYYHLVLGLLVLIAGAGIGFSFIRMEDDVPEEVEELEEIEEVLEQQTKRRKNTDEIVKDLEKTRRAVGDSK
jgi:hypothetical protein